MDKAFYDKLFMEIESKTILLTGATDGIGRETAKILAKAPCNLILHGRNPAKMESLLRELKIGAKASMNSVFADLSQIAEVHKLAEEVKTKHSGLNLLINNAGTMQDKSIKSADGIELTFMINYLAPFLLTFDLLPCLEHNEKPRVVFLGSLGHRVVRADPADLQSWKPRFGFVRYCRSKLLLMSFALKLGLELAEKPITLISVHPGVIPTTKVFNVPFLKPFSHNKVEGAEAVLNAALNPAYEGFKGVYLERYKISVPSAQVRDTAFGDLLWQESLKLCGLEGLQIP
ncbi:MAG: SDR family NAD(P)-dependent oxidoreductase [Anaerolineaceae bacterium]|nr:SDR family NAD(P)-dependent oxidoreductase [Anaerolineaceae bacterium]